MRDIVPTIDHDKIDGYVDQLTGHRGQLAEIPSGKPVVDRDVLAINIAEVSQTFSKTVEYFGIRALRQRQDANPKHLPKLLCRAR
jgi:hypothetical protein